MMRELLLQNMEDQRAAAEERGRVLAEAAKVLDLTVQQIADLERVLDLHTLRVLTTRVAREFDQSLNKLIERLVQAGASACGKLRLEPEVLDFASQHPEVLEDALRVMRDSAVPADEDGCYNIQLFGIDRPGKRARSKSKCKDTRRRERGWRPR